MGRQGWARRFHHSSSACFAKTWRQAPSESKDGNGGVAGRHEGPVGAESALRELIDPGWRTTIAKSFAGVEIPVAHVDPTLDFDEVEPHVRHFLRALIRLQEFCLRREAAEAIEANRGIRRP